MNTLKSFAIPVKGLKIGTHGFNFELRDSFFKAIYAESEYKANLKVHVDFDKRENMYILEIKITGTRDTSCDRCLENIHIPIDVDHKIFLKRGIGKDDGDIVYVENFDDEINIASYIYDCAILSFPLTNIMDCDEMDDPPCNTKLLDKWDESLDFEENKGNNIWNELNNLNLD